MSGPPISECVCAIPSKDARDHRITCPVFRWWAGVNGADAFDRVGEWAWRRYAELHGTQLTRCVCFGRTIMLPGDPDDVGAALVAAGVPGVRFTRETLSPAHYAGSEILPRVVETIVVVDSEPVRPNHGE